MTNFDTRHTQKEVQEELLKVLKTLFEESNFIAEVFITLPNADYNALLQTLLEHNELFQSRKIDWQIKHIDTGFEIRFDRTNSKLCKKVI